MDAAGVLPNFGGVAVHDAWAPYDTYPQLTHALCNAHLLRELIAVTDHHTATATDPESWCWAQQVIDALLAIKTLTDSGPVPIDPTLLGEHRTLITHAARLGARGTEGGKVAQKHRALARRITTRLEDYLSLRCRKFLGQWPQSRIALTERSRCGTEEVDVYTRV